MMARQRGGQAIPWLCNARLSKQGQEKEDKQGWDGEALV